MGSSSTAQREIMNEIIRIKERMKNTNFRKKWFTKSLLFECTYTSFNFVFFAFFYFHILDLSAGTAIESHTGTIAFTFVIVYILLFLNYYYRIFVEQCFVRKMQNWNPFWWHLINFRVYSTQFIAVEWSCNNTWYVSFLTKNRLIFRWKRTTIITAHTNTHIQQSVAHLIEHSTFCHIIIIICHGRLRVILIHLHALYLPNLYCFVFFMHKTVSLIPFVSHWVFLFVFYDAFIHMHNYLSFVCIFT